MGGAKTDNDNLFDPMPRAGGLLEEVDTFRSSGLLKILKNPVDQFLASLASTMVHGSHKA